MNIDDKMMMDLASRVGMGKNPNKAKSMVEEVAANYAGKSDEQLLTEIMKLKQVIKKDPRAYNQQLQAIQALRPMMNAEQRSKLDSLMAMLK